MIAPADDRGSADLDPQERREAVERESPGAGVTHEAIRREGEKELARAPSALAWSGLAAGLSMGLSMAAQAVLRTHLPDEVWRPLVERLGYAVGFLVVILGSQQLYTENTLTPIVPLMARPSVRMLRRVLVLWGVVLAANLVGTMAFAWAAATTGVFAGDVRAAFVDMGREVLAPGTGATFVRAVAAGWIIALMAWMLPAAESARLAVIVIMTWLLAACDLQHVVAGSAEVFYLVVQGEISFATYAVRWLPVVAVGNTLGGVLLVAAVNHAQVKAG
ncbi:formate/nitrite transporter family protein [Roseisolibacter sp. H3M3-2]|uniref:formate/nitrite transporter family protein n=1 Tax=Roseisolibacter sp. H3M3-2 TaxID=3031323 RepID=UPI0023DBE9C4|nr:formate/nitrite transporter family protein [Roseisolibacter sp. H3M3-2]MDF1503531.1 formate/nitrite transporter family protein [Roseisolibacter sp. H3M3-2]